jgi:hypothetical protein
MHIPNPEPPVEETLADLKETDPKYHQTLVDMTKSKDSDTTTTPSKVSTEKGRQQPVTYRAPNSKNVCTLKEKGQEGKW